MADYVKRPKPTDRLSSMWVWIRRLGWIRIS
jgi:hypothetical protein